MSQAIMLRTGRPGKLWAPSVLFLPPNLPAGIYDAAFAKSAWKSVEVKNVETTVLEPGVLEINHGSLYGNQVVDSETGLVHGEISSIKRSITLMPGLYDVTFGKAVWPVVRVDSGKTTTLNDGILRVTGASFSGNRVHRADGKEAGDLSSLQTWISLPPGSYTIEVRKGKKSFTIKERQELTMDVKEYEYRTLRSLKLCLPVPDVCKAQANIRL